MDRDRLQLLKSCDIFASLDDATLRDLLNSFSEVTLAKNQVLFRQGDFSHDLYLVVSGKLAVFLHTAKRQRILVSDILPGKLVGEMAALTHEPRSMSVQAVYPSVVLKLPSEKFIELCKKFPAVSMALINTTLARSRNFIQVVTEKKNIKKHLVVLPVNGDDNLQVLQSAIANQLKNFSDVVVLSDNDENVAELKNKIDALDQQNKTIIYFIHSLTSNLAKVCFEFEYIDMIYLVAAANVQPAISQPVRDIIDANRYKITPELILLYVDEQKTPQHTGRWLRLMRFNLHHHIRITRDTDWQRLLRFMTGSAIGVVLGGGGLRCWAHIGALKALQEFGVPIDAIGGVSAGSIVAGFFAMTESLENLDDLRKLSELTRQAVSWKNLTWPSAAIFNGRDYTDMLQTIFKKIRIENLWTPCFTISANLGKNQQMIARSGYLWKLIRASTAVPLVFPPVVVKGELRLDGGLLNNLPVDVMKRMTSGRGEVIAVELTHQHEDDTQYNFPPKLSFWSSMLAKLHLGYKQYRFPHLIDTFLKSLLAGAAAKQAENSTLADILISPDLSKFHMLSVTERDEDQLIKIGYDDAVLKLKKRKSNNTVSKRCRLG